MSGGRLADRGVDHVRVDRGQLIGIVAAIAQDLALLGIAKIGQVDFIELQIAAAGIGERLHGAAVGGSQIAVELFHVRIDFRADGACARRGNAAPTGRRDRHLRGGAACGRAGSGSARPSDAWRIPILPSHAQTLGLRLDPTLKRDAVIRAEGFHAVQPLQKIEVPHGAAELAIGRAAQDRSPPGAR